MGSVCGGCLQDMFADLSACHRGYIVGGLVFGLAILVIWSAVLFVQVVQAHRVPVETTQLRRLPRFPSAGFVVVSKFCVVGPPFAHEQQTPMVPPLFDFASVSAIGIGSDGQSTVSLRRPDPDGVLWRQEEFLDSHHGGGGNYTCTFSVAGLLTNRKNQCLKRTFKMQKWYSQDGWQPCDIDTPFDPLVGLSVGNWSTEADEELNIRAFRQLRPSWPTETFFLLPTVEDGLHLAVDAVHQVLRQTLSGAVDYATALVVQQALSVRFSSGVWLFQATNTDPFANIGPLAVTLRASRCEGTCEKGTTRHSLSATIEKAAPRWRQPLCDPDLRHISAHQGCVPIVFQADMQEAVIISTVAFRWPNLFAQWLSPVIVFMLLFPGLVLAPYCLRAGGENGDSHEVSGLVAGREDPHQLQKAQAVGRMHVDGDDDV